MLRRIACLSCVCISHAYKFEDPGDDLLVIWRYSSPFADWACSRVMPQCWTVLTPKVNESEVVVIPLGLRQQHLQVSFSLLNSLAFCKTPALR